MIDTVIAFISQRINLDPSIVRSGLSVLLGFLKKEAPDNLVLQLIEKIPGSEALMNAAPSTGSGGMLGGLLGAASSMLGGKSGALMVAGAEMQKAGVPMEKVPGFLDAFKEKASELAGPELVQSLLDALAPKS